MMTEQNYYIAYYQAVREKNVQKTVKLSHFSDKEQENYPNEYPELEYDNIFQDQDPDDFIEAIIKSEEYQEFYSSCLVETKNTLANYIIAGYKAIIEQNFSKFKQLEDLDYEDQVNYPNEHPELEYNDIFKDQDPDDILRDLTLNNSEILSFAYDLINPLATEDTLVKREENFNELMKYPLIDYCPNPDLGLKITDKLASYTYSKIFNLSNFKHSITPLINNLPILAKLFATIALSTIVDSKKPFSIALVGQDINNYDPTCDNETGGFHHSVRNTLVVTNKNNQVHLPFLAHELSHKLMHLLFGDLNPYPHISIEIKNQYHQAIKDTLLNIKQFVQDKFNLDIKIEENDSTWDIGKKLCSVLFPEYLSEDSDIKNLITILQNNDLEINNNFLWIDESYIERVAYRLSLETADLMIKNNFNLKHDILISAAGSSSLDLTNWYLEQDNIDINFKNKFGDSALEHAKDPEIIKTLIAAGANPYSASYYDKTCTIELTYNETQVVSTTLKNQLTAIRWFLALYLQYDRSDEDAEFIVRLPQIMAADLYQGEIVSILAPMAQYWEEVITPAIIEYQDQHDPSNLCLPLTGETYYEL